MLSCWLLLAGAGIPVVHPANPPEPASMPAPIVHVVSDVDLAKGVVIVEKVTIRAVRRDVTEKLLVNGRPIPRGRYSLVHVHEVQHVALRVGNAEARTLAGKSLTINDALERLRLGMRIVMSADGRPVAAEHLKNLPPETIVLIPPARE